MTTNRHILLPAFAVCAALGAAACGKDANSEDNPSLMEPRAGSDASEAGVGGDGEAGTGGSGQAGVGGGDGVGTAGVGEAGAGAAGVGGNGDAGASGSGNAGMGGVPAAATLPLDVPPQPQGCIDNVGPAEQLVFGSCGADIVFNVSVPEACMTTACGLIFDVHGWTMSGPIQEQNTGLAARGREEGYIVVQPSAPGASWSAANHDSVVIAFLELAIATWKVETRRVHFTGFSQGGAMTYRMRCAIADALASVAPVAMRGAACEAGTRAVPTFYIMGQNDVFVSAAQAESTVQGLISAHQLDIDDVVSTGDRHTWTRYRNSDGLVFEHLDHSYTSPPLGGHCFPGSLDPVGLYGCLEEAPFEHGRIVMDFFKAHPKVD